MIAAHHKSNVHVHYEIERIHSVAHQDFIINIKGNDRSHHKYYSYGK